MIGPSMWGAVERGLVRELSLGESSLLKLAVLPDVMRAVLTEGQADAVGFVGGCSSD